MKFNFRFPKINWKLEETHFVKSELLSMTCSNSAKLNEPSSSRSASSRIFWISWSMSKSLNWLLNPMSLWITCFKSFLLSMSSPSKSNILKACSDFTDLGAWSENTLIMSRKSSNVQSPDWSPALLKTWQILSANGLQVSSAIPLTILFIESFAFLLWFTFSGLIVLNFLCALRRKEKCPKVKIA